MTDGLSSSSVSARWVALVLLAAITALGLRLIWIDVRLRETPHVNSWRAQASLEAPLSKAAWLHDEQLYYISTAVNAFRGRGFFPDYNKVRDGIFVPPPLQSILILLVFRAAGGLVEPFTLLAWQAVAASVMVVMIAALGRRLVSPGAGLICACLTALHPDFIRWSGYVLTESNYLVGFSLLAFLFARWAGKPTLSGALATALVLGLLNLERPNAIWLSPVIAVFALTLLGMRRGIASCAIFLIVPILVMLPWRQRNLKVYDEPIWVSSNLGVYLYIANSPKLDALATPYMDDANRGRRLMSSEIEQRLRAPDGRLRVTYYRYSKAYVAAFFDYVRTEPLHFLRNYFVKLIAQFWLVPDSRPVSDLFGIPARAYQLAQRLLILLGFLGLAVTLWLRPSRALFACALLFAYFAASGGLAGTDLSARYTLVVRLLLLVFFSTGLVSAVNSLKAARA